MKLLRFFKKSKSYQSYKLSERASIYEKIAAELNNEAQHVYEIAHGKSPKCFDDLVICNRLSQNGIIKKK